MNDKLIIVVLFKMFFNSGEYLFAQQKEQSAIKEVSSKMYLVDTITIKYPLVIKVTDSIGKFQYVLIENKGLVMVDTLIKQGSEQYILKNESLFCPTYKFTCLLNNYISLNNKKESIYTRINVLIKKSKAEVWKEIDENKALENKYYSIYTLNISTFLVILVRNDFFNFCQSRDEIKTNDNANLYRKILIPVIWETTNK